MTILATLACTIGPNGITAPTYDQIIGSLVSSYQAVYGADVSIDPSTQDYEMLAIFAAAINDCNAATIATYNEFSPATAVGVGLSSVVKINGLQRDIPTNSTADLLLVGTAGLVIGGGQVGDDQNLGTSWALDPLVTISNAGTVVTTATCTTQGAVAAAADTLTNILTPTNGWISANNAAAATLGAPVESDAALRRRQSVSTSLPALTPLAAIVAAVENVVGVESVVPYENVTGSTDSNGLPAHSICLVVAGGDAQTIANAIGAKKGLCDTYGSTSETYVDPGGVSVTINFQRPGATRLIAAVTIAPLAGYTSTTGVAILAAMSAYVASLPVGALVSLNELTAVALLPGTGLGSTYNIAPGEVTQALFGNSLLAQDLQMTFDEEADLAVADITLTI